MANNQNINEEEYITNNFQIDYLSQSRSTNESSSKGCDCNVVMKVDQGILYLSVNSPTSVVK